MSCPYLEPQWRDVFLRSGMTPLQVTEKYRRRGEEAIRLGYDPYPCDPCKRQTLFYISGLDNPYSSELAWKVMLNEAKRGLGRHRAAAESKLQEVA